MSRRPRSIGAASLLVCLLVTAPSGSPTGTRAAIDHLGPRRLPHDPGVRSTRPATATRSACQPGTYFETIDTTPSAITLESARGAGRDDHRREQYGTAVTVVTMAEPGETPVLRGLHDHERLRRFRTPAASRTSGGPALIEGNRIVHNAGCIGAGIAAFRPRKRPSKDNPIARNRQTMLRRRDRRWRDPHQRRRDRPVIGNTIEDNCGRHGRWRSGSTAPARRRSSENIIQRQLRRTTTVAADHLRNHPNDALIANNLIVGNFAPVGGGIGAAMLPNSAARRADVVNNTLIGKYREPGSSDLRGRVPSPARGMRTTSSSGPTTQTTVECASPYGRDPASLRSQRRVQRRRAGVRARPATRRQARTATSPWIPGSWTRPLGTITFEPTHRSIDAGTNTGAPTTDVDGDARPHDGDENGTAVADIGFDEAIDPVLVDLLELVFDDTVATVASQVVPVVVKNLGSSSVSVTSATITGSGAADLRSSAVPARARRSGGSPVFGPDPVHPERHRCSHGDPHDHGTRRLRCPHRCLSGTGLDPVLVTPGNLDFGPVPRGTTQVHAPSMCSTTATRR